ncbi:unnamed protein product, partial [Closterium sp. Naga37s-1]
DVGAAGAAQDEREAQRPDHFLCLPVSPMFPQPATLARSHSFNTTPPPSSFPFSSHEQEMSEQLGLRKMNERLSDPTMGAAFDGIFPKDTPKNTRFAINFFTSIGLGGLTDNLREHLKNMPKLIMQQQKPVQVSETCGERSAALLKRG